ncbi:Chromatin structure-remodeling complex subunit rsc7 [Neolecta irregularis DAH-3]|uniref:Chromatin structure-remodeling complex subunit rsc7 n=1 Tax=Neolecta irregularis (strain DAH-3) TaxID=1198029 RepID=A0A1U7LT39_NEOID|nr:Chromatin structure-remodeling complex subunit rsc7 [Neolecta irregularis DAH-3]|eukprot:OLL25827.1 Chromatin structure-remodeling complex subunit rsc7 [Neolecta irregularis DAH-3]
MDFDDSKGDSPLTEFEEDSEDEQIRVKRRERKPSEAIENVASSSLQTIKQDPDEHSISDIDEAGESKITEDGDLLSGREFKVRTFKFLGRGEKKFMLATEAARPLGYRDSYLFYQKNKSLKKIAEKDFLITTGIIPQSYRSRQIAVVTARSVFRAFGGKMIKDGRRVIDDYWEKEAITEGFTASDIADADLPQLPPATFAIPQDERTPRPKKNLRDPALVPHREAHQSVSLDGMFAHAKSVRELNSVYASQRRERKQMYHEYFMPAAIAQRAADLQAQDQ